MGRKFISDNPSLVGDVLSRLELFGIKKMEFRSFGNDDMAKLENWIYEAASLRQDLRLYAMYLGRNEIAEGCHFCVNHAASLRQLTQSGTSNACTCSASASRTSASAPMSEGQELHGCNLAFLRQPPQDTMKPQRHIFGASAPPTKFFY